MVVQLILRDKLDSWVGISQETTAYPAGYLFVGGGVVSLWMRPFYKPVAYLNQSKSAPLRRRSSNVGLWSGPEIGLTGFNDRKRSKAAGEPVQTPQGMCADSLLTLHGSPALPAFLKAAFHQFATSAHPAPLGQVLQPVQHGFGARLFVVLRQPDFRQALVGWQLPCDTA